MTGVISRLGVLQFQKEIQFFLFHNVQKVPGRKKHIYKFIMVLDGGESIKLLVDILLKPLLNFHHLNMLLLSASAGPQIDCA
jgi:hypothetical protein